MTATTTATAHATRRAIRRALVAWVAVTGIVATTAAATAAGAPGISDLADAVYPHAPRPGHVSVSAAGLLAHNAAITLCPLLLIAARWHTAPRWRAAGDSVVAALLAYNAVAVGLGIGAWPQVLGDLPHLPIELGGLACGAGAWWALSRGAGLVCGARFVACAIALLAVASVLEVAAV